MISSDERNKMKVAIDWINKLANGMNPIDGSTLPDSDIVNMASKRDIDYFSAKLLIIIYRTLQHPLPSLAATVLTRIMTKNELRLSPSTILVCIKA